MSVSFTYVHGGFTGTNTRFAFYFPPASKYKGRFFQTTYPTLSQEDAAPGCPEVGASACSVVFALSKGAYVVSTNNNGGIPSGAPLAAYRANAASAKYSRLVAAQIYGGTSRPRGYIYGASGGAYQTVGSMENTDGVWDGAVPMVFGVPNAIPSFFGVQLLALRDVGDKMAQVADAMAPGGGGDPYAGLTAAQSAALKEAARLGMPLRGWWQYATLNGAGIAATGGAVRAIDPSYGQDFWTEPGYEGADPAVRAARVQFETSVTRVDGDKRLVLAGVPAGDIANADLIVTSGPAAGRTLNIDKVASGELTVSKTDGITAGTKVRIDNSWLLALQYYQRHQIPHDHEYGWDQYLGPDGAPLYSQRRIIVGPILNANTAGSVADGHFHGKMIMVGSTMDVLAYPWSEDWYRKQAQQALGPKLADSYRLWFMDNADHGPDLAGYAAGVGFDRKNNAPDHIVGYIGEVQQALLDLDAWVAKGAPPPLTTGYRVDADDQVELSASAGGRHGVQPLASLRARAGATSSVGEKVEAAVGEPVSFTLTAQTPADAGKIVRAEWDFDGSGGFSPNGTPIFPARMITVEATHTFEKPGIYFTVARVTSQREGDQTTPFGRVQNLATVRVIVH